MELSAVIEVALLLFSKHFIVDFLFQTRFPYQWMNKGRYFHLGGILHVLLHGIATIIVLDSHTTHAIALGALDAFVHYHIDWAKVNIAAWRQWDVKTPEFWDLIGFDQYLHALTYIFMLWFIFE